MNRNIYQILADLETVERGALIKRDAGRLRIMVRNRVVIRQEDDLILHRVNDDGMIDVYCMTCGKYVTSTYDDFIRKYPDKWKERKEKMYESHKAECTPRAVEAEVAATKA